MELQVEDDVAGNRPGGEELGRTVYPFDCERVDRVFVVEELVDRLCPGTGDDFFVLRNGFELPSVNDFINDRLQLDSDFVVLGQGVSLESRDRDVQLSL